SPTVAIPIATTRARWRCWFARVRELAARTKARRGHAVDRPACYPRRQFGHRVPPAGEPMRLHGHQVAAEPRRARHVAARTRVASGAPPRIDRDSTLRALAVRLEAAPDERPVPAAGSPTQSVFGSIHAEAALNEPH